MSVCLCVCVCVSVYLCVCLSVYFSVCLFLHTHNIVVLSSFKQLEDGVDRSAAEEEDRQLAVSEGKRLQGLVDGLRGELR